MGNKLTLISDDGQWKAELRAWQNYFFIYRSIGSEATVYHRERTRNIWGQSTTDWVKRSTAIFIENTYKGATPPGVFVQTAQFNGSHGELKLWAWGLILIKINLDTGDVSAGPNQAILDISSVSGRITVATGRQPLTGTVSASSWITENSIW